MSAVYSLYSSPTHVPVPDHLPTLIVTPHGKPQQILYTYLHTNYNRENYLLTPSPQGDLCVAKLFPPPTTQPRSSGGKTSSEGHGSASGGSHPRTVKCEASRNFRWSITNSGVLTPTYKCTLPADDSPGGMSEEQPLFQISKTNPSSPFWTMWYYAYAGHLIPPKRIQFGHISKTVTPDGKPVTGGGTRVTISGKTDDEKAVWKTLGEGNEDMVEWAVICAALHVLDDEIVKAAEAAGIRIGVLPGSNAKPAHHSSTPPPMPHNIPRPQLHPTGQTPARAANPPGNLPMPEGYVRPPQPMPPHVMQQQQQRNGVPMQNGRGPPQQQQQGPPPPQQQHGGQQDSRIRQDPRVQMQNGPPPQQQRQPPPHQQSYQRSPPQQQLPPHQQQQHQNQQRQPMSPSAGPNQPSMQAMQQQRQGPSGHQGQPILPHQQMIPPPRQHIPPQSMPHPSSLPQLNAMSPPLPHPQSMPQIPLPGPSNQSDRPRLLSSRNGPRPQQTLPPEQIPRTSPPPLGPGPGPFNNPRPGPNSQQGRPNGACAHPPPQYANGHGPMPRIDTHALPPPGSGGVPPRSAPPVSINALRAKSPLPAPGAAGPLPPPGSSAPSAFDQSSSSRPMPPNGHPAPFAQNHSSQQQYSPGGAPPNRMSDPPLANPPPRRSSNRVQQQQQQQSRSSKELSEEDTVDSVAFMLGTTALNDMSALGDEDIGFRRNGSGPVGSDGAAQDSAPQSRVGRLLRNR